MDNQSNSTSNSVPQSETVKTPSEVINSTPIQTTPTQGQVVSTPAPQKKSNGVLWCIVIALVLGLITLCCICIVPFVGLSALAPLAGTTTSQNFDKSPYTQVEPNDVVAGENPVQNNYDNLVKQNPNTPFVLKITEKQLLEQIVANAESKDIANGIFLNFDTNKASLKIDLSKILDSMPNSANQLNINPSDVEGILLDVEAKVASDGKSLEVTKVSTGSSLFDLFLGTDINQTVSDAINEAFIDLTRENSHSIQKIEIKDGEMDITFAPKRL